MINKYIKSSNTEKVVVDYCNQRIFDLCETDQEMMEKFQVGF